MRKLIFSFIVAFCIVLPSESDAQRLLLHENVDTTNEIPTFGPNRTWYVYPLIKFGVFTPPYEKGGVTNFWSTTASYEIRTKLKLLKWNALVFDIGYRGDRFIINQNDTSYLPTYSGRHKRERLSTHNATIAVCDRINFGRRGNIQGIYCDIGLYADYVMRSAHLAVDEYYDSNSPVAGHAKVRVKTTRLQFINEINYGITARFGWEWGSAFVMYRMTDLIEDNLPDTDYPDMPFLSVGMEMYFVSY